MKTLPASSGRRSQRGSAVIVIIAMLAIMIALISVNAISVRSLNQELRLLENKQNHRLENNGRKF
jgi:Tfp pilus assembly protein PilX